MIECIECGMSSSRELKGWGKGQFCSKQKLEGKIARLGASKKRWTEFRALKEQKRLEGDRGNLATSPKRRVVELSQLAADLLCKKCRIPISLRNLEREEQHGLASILFVRCLGCDTLVRVCTAKPAERNEKLFNVNLKLAVGMIDSGSGVEPINNLLSALNIPSVSHKLFKRHERMVGQAIEAVASDSCAKNIQLEIALSDSRSTSTPLNESSTTGDDTSASSSRCPLAESTPLGVNSSTLSVNSAHSSSPPPAPSPCNLSSEMGNSSDLIPSPPRSGFDPTPPELTLPGVKKLTGSFDAGWQKKGSQRCYNSTSGHGSLFGYHSKKILAYDTLSTRCRMCEAGRSLEDHKCCKNHTGSAKSMEPQMAVNIITKNQQLHDAHAVVDTLIGDDDASTMHSVRRESTVPVTKWSDINHVEKGFSSALYTLQVPEDVRNYLRSCFGVIIHCNRDNPEQLRHDLQNATAHAYGQHTNCGSWCRCDPEHPNDYKHDGLPGGKDLTDLDLRASLIKLFDRYAQNAEKIAPCGSSQLNENFNKVVSSKHPKDKHYAGSESLRFRVSSAVCQVNEGRMYVTHVNRKLSLSPGKETIKHRTKRDAIRTVRAAKQATKEFKRKRLFRKRNRARKGATIEQKEGLTYDSGCGLDLDGIAALVDDPSVPSTLPPDTDTALVYVDLETTGLSKTSCEILQVAAKVSEGPEYSAYILPHKGISPSASIVTGITVSNGLLFLHGEVVNTTPPRIALNGLVEFLRNIGKPVVLVAHNGFRFDAPIILRHYQNLGLLSAILEIVKGFVDALEVMRATLPNRKESFKQSTLAAFYGIDTTNAHDALADVRMLSRIIDSAGVPHATMMRHAKTVASIIEREKNLGRAKVCKAELQVLKSSVSTSMISKIVAAGITLSTLKSAFERGGEKGLDFLLRESVDKKPRVSNNKKVVSGIIAAVKAQF